MKIARISLQVCVLVMFVFCVVARTQDADKQKMIDAEKAFAAITNAGPESAATAKKYLFDGSLNQLTPLGRVGTLPKARVVELSATPDPNDPNVKSTTTASDFHVDIYGDAALVSYKETNTDKGHKDPALNTTDHFTCLDTFIQRSGTWYIVGNACAPSAPLPDSEWAAVKKAIAAEPKDVQNAYH
jgi:hypothetical protein